LGGGDNQTLQRREGSLTCSLAALLGPVLVDVEGEQEVGVPPRGLVTAPPAGAPGGQGRVQEGGGALRCGGAQLPLVLELRRRRRRRRRRIV